VSKLRITLGCWNYDRTRALADGRIQPEGIDLNYINMPVEETFFRMLRYREFEAAEMSLSSYTVSLFSKDKPFIAIPVFPSRFFRHSSIYINAASGIREPRDLVGKRVGNPEYQMTAPAWIRGILSDEHGVPVTSVTYFTGGEEEPGRPEKIKLDLPRDIHIERIGERMLQRLFEIAETMGAQWLTLEVRVSNIAAQRLYQKYGFRQAGVRRRYYSDNNEDALIMWTERIRDRGVRDLLTKLRRALEEEPSR